MGTVLPTELVPFATWTVNELVSQTDQANPDMCYIAIFAGEACSSDGGVYKVSSSWYSDHFGGSLGDLGSCGKVIESWLERSGGHQKFASSLASNSDLEMELQSSLHTVSGMGTLATFTAEFACQPTPLPTEVGSPAQTSSPSGSPLTLTPASMPPPGDDGAVDGEAEGEADGVADA